MFYKDCVVQNMEVSFKCVEILPQSFYPKSNLCLSRSLVLTHLAPTNRDKKILQLKEWAHEVAVICNQIKFF